MKGDEREVYAPLSANHPRVSIRDLLGADPNAQVDSGRQSDIDAAVERGRQQGWREAIEALRDIAATRSGASLSDAVEDLTSVAPTEGSQTSAT